MPTIAVQPCPTAGERPLDEVESKQDLRDHAEIIEDWVAPRQSWEFQLRHVLTTT